MQDRNKLRHPRMKAEGIPLVPYVRRDSSVDKTSKENSYWPTATGSLQGSATNHSLENDPVRREIRRCSHLAGPRTDSGRPEASSRKGFREKGRCLARGDLEKRPGAVNACQRKRERILGDANPYKVWREGKSWRRKRKQKRLFRTSCTEKSLNQMKHHFGEGRRSNIKSGKDLW